VYAIGSPVFDYLTTSGGTYELNGNSSLLQLLDCVEAAGTTSYANAIEEAQHELDVHGRGDVQDVIVFLSDGAANTTPRFVPSYLTSAGDRARPCNSGIRAADEAKGRGTAIYTIGYDLNGEGTDYERCKVPNTNEDEGITAYDAIRRIASVDEHGKPHFYNQPDPKSLNLIFTRIAADLQRPAARLIDNDLS
jgi:hypothetical protein